MENQKGEREVMPTWNELSSTKLGDIHKARGQLRGRVANQMTILFNKSDHEGRVKNTQNLDHVVYG